MRVLQCVCCSVCVCCTPFCSWQTWYTVCVAACVAACVAVCAAMCAAVCVAVCAAVCPAVCPAVCCSVCVCCIVCCSVCCTPPCSWQMWYTACITVISRDAIHVITADNNTNNYGRMHKGQHRILRLLTNLDFKLEHQSFAHVIYD